MVEPEFHSAFKSSGGIMRIARAARYSWLGLSAAFRHESAFRQELLLVACLAPAAFWLGETAAEIMVLLAALVFILIVELLNSAIEALADAISTKPHPMLGRAKDLGSAAVFLTILVALGIWGAVAVGRIMA